MSFDLNSASAFKPKVESTFLGKGGGNGSTGYFKMKKKKQEEEESILSSNSGSVDFIESMDTYGSFEAYQEESMLDKLKGFIKKFQ
ncbi:MAG: hypothetical protein PHX18_06320 [Candidatus Gastranaerophilales bacterium]|nr:hypothetical protein [Candidatus Gastranaerophilales bacterium]